MALSRIRPGRAGLSGRRTPFPRGLCGPRAGPERSCRRAPAPVPSPVPFPVSSDLHGRGLCPDVAVPRCGCACRVFCGCCCQCAARRGPWAGLCPSGLAGRPAVDGRSGGGPSAPWEENTKFGSAVSAPRSERNSPEASSALGLGRPERAGSPQGGLRPRRAVLSPGRPCGCRGSQGPAGLPSGLCLPPLSKAVVPGPGALFLSIAHP